MTPTLRRIAGITAGRPRRAPSTNSKRLNVDGDTPAFNPHRRGLQPRRPPGATRDLVGKCHGMTADPALRQVIATDNQDAHSNIYLINRAGNNEKPE